MVIFCNPSELQLTLYHQLLRCQLIRSCLAGSLSGSPHLICIGALKQLCNHPALLYQKAKKHEALAEETEFDEAVSYLTKYLKCLLFSLIKILSHMISRILTAVFQVLRQFTIIVYHLLHRIILRFSGKNGTL